MGLPIPERTVEFLAALARFVGMGNRFALGEAKHDPMGALAGEVTDPFAREWLRDLQRTHRDLTITGTTWGWASAAITAMRRARTTRAQDVNGPALVAVADEEKSVDPASIRKLAARLEAHLVEIHGGHDLFLAPPVSRTNLIEEIRVFVDRALG